MLNADSLIDAAELAKLIIWPASSVVVAQWCALNFFNLTLAN